MAWGCFGMTVSALEGRCEENPLWEEMTKQQRKTKLSCKVSFFLKIRGPLQRKLAWCWPANRTNTSQKRTKPVATELRTCRKHKQHLLFPFPHDTYSPELAPFSSRSGNEMSPSSGWIQEERTSFPFWYTASSPLEVHTFCFSEAALGWKQRGFWPWISLDLTLA